MENELRITFDSDGNCEVEIHGLSGTELIIAINELIISVKKCSEKCGVSKNSKMLNRHIQTAVDRALNGEHFTSEEDVAIEMLKDTFKEMINDLEAKLKHETEKEKKDEEDEE